MVRLCRERSLHWCLSLYGNPHNYGQICALLLLLLFAVVCPGQWQISVN